MRKYEAVIGLEIHAELKTKSKMFCGCKNEPFFAKPNENICPICTGMPGTLPVLNKQAIEMTIKTGLALGCKIGHPFPRRSASQSAKSALLTKWDRKNYFYPDLPKGYQISQYDLPMCYRGHLEVGGRKIGITRIHLEEDTGTSKHPEGRANVDYSLLDYNRSGVPLMELVTEPDIKTAREAKEFCQQYQLILRTLGVADADMEKGQMRCETNISLREIADQRGLDADCRGKNISVSQRASQRQSAPLGTKVEVKNLNSFKAVERAIEYEIERQTEVLEAGKKVIQETRGWDDKKAQTYTMRVKETSADYRYFPEPDLPPVVLAERRSTRTGKYTQINADGNVIDVDKIKKQLPEMPEEKLVRYIKEYKLPENEARMIANNGKMAEYFEKITQNPKLKTQNYNSKLKTIANFIINELPDLSVEKDSLIDLINLLDEGKISGKIAKEILPEIKKGKSPAGIIKSKGLGQISNTEELEKIVDKILSRNSDAVAKIKSGQMGVMGFLVGQIMCETKGQANPQIVNEILRKKLL